MWMASLAVVLLAADGPAPSLSWANGLVTAVARGGETLPALGPGGFAIRDCAREAAYQPVPVTMTGGGQRFEGQRADGKLGLKGTITGERGWLAVRGELVNLDGEEHAVSLRFALPVACSGWRWDRRLHSSERLAPGHVRRLGVASKIGTGRTALRPVAAVTDGRQTAGLAVPLDYIGQYDFAADPDAGLLAVNFDLAMTPHAPRFLERAPFSFYVVIEPSGWGLRAVLDRYYTNLPELFERHLPEAGGWFAWGDLLRQPPPLCDYGLVFHEQPESEAAFGHEAKLGIRIFPYIEPIMYQMSFGDQEDRPTKEMVLERMKAWARPETTGRQPSGGYPTQESLRDICQALLASGARDAKGDLLITSIAQYSWIGGSRWAAQIPLNLDPDAPGGIGQRQLVAIDQLARDERADGIYLDSFSGYLDQVNYAQEQLGSLRFAPQFDAATFRPCVQLGYAAMAWVEAVWERLPAGRQALLPNLYHQPTPFPWHRFSVLGKEHWTEAAGPLMQQYRAMGYRKVVTQLPAYEDQDPRFLRNLLLLGVFPGGYARRETDPPQGMRATYRVVIPLLRMLDRLGWEPITAAVATDGGSQIERYGSGPGPVALVVRNPYLATTARLSVDPAGLGLPDDAGVIDVLDGAAVEYSRKGDGLDLAIGLDDDTTTVLVLGDAAAQARWRAMLAEDRVSDARLCLAEYALRHNGQEHPEAVSAADWGEDPAILAAAAARLPADDPCLGRARELLLEATRLLAPAPAPRSRPVAAPTLSLPPAWRETFDLLAPERWQVPARAEHVATRDGRLVMSLPPDATSLNAACRRAVPFVPRAAVLELDFEYNHGPHNRYLMMGWRITATAQGSAEYLLVRIEGDASKGLVWIENHEGPATNYTYRLTPQAAFTTGQPHHLRIRLDRQRVRLELDGQLVGEALHECEFASAYSQLGVQSGHRGQGDVCWWDNFAVSYE